MILPTRFWSCSLAVTSALARNYLALIQLACGVVWLRELLEVV